MTRLKRWALLALAIVAVLVSGCGGGSHHKKPATAGQNVTLAVVKADTGRTCSPSNIAMQCVLPGLTLPKATGQELIAADNTRLYGVDFAWGGPRSCGQMHALGARFGASYLSYDSSKNWNRALVNEFHGCGLGVVSVWETTASRAAQGFAAGASDARTAGNLAAALGNTHDAISFAIDFDANGPEVYSYFKGAQSVLGSRVNAYGGYRPLAYLRSHGAVGNLNWQTYAWSRGLWLPASIAPLEQYLNGGSFDNDRAIAANYGQSPAPPPPGPSPAQIKHWHDLGQAKNIAFRIYKHNHCRQPQGKSPYCAIESRVIVSAQNELWAASQPKRFACFGPNARGHTKTIICWIVRPEAAWYSSARDASKRALRRCLQAGPVTFPTPCKQAHTFAQRVRYFGAKATALVKAYS